MTVRVSDLIMSVLLCPEGWKTRFCRLCDMEYLGFQCVHLEPHHIHKLKSLSLSCKPKGPMMSTTIQQNSGFEGHPKCGHPVWDTPTQGGPKNRIFRVFQISQFWDRDAPGPFRTSFYDSQRTFWYDMMICACIHPEKKSTWTMQENFLVTP